MSVASTDISHELLRAELAQLIAAWRGCAEDAPGLGEASQALAYALNPSGSCPHGVPVDRFLVEIPRPHRDARRVVCPCCHATGWDVPTGGGRYEPDDTRCPDCGCAGIPVHPIGGDYS